MPIRPTIDAGYLWEGTDRLPCHETASEADRDGSCLADPIDIAIPESAFFSTPGDGNGNRMRI